MMSRLFKVILCAICMEVVVGMTKIKAEGYAQLTNIPTIYIETDSGKDPTDKKHQIPCTITIVSDDGKSVLRERGVVRLRGNGTLKLPKKPYRIKFEHKQRPLGAPANARKWTLLANYGDKSLMRNAVAFYIAQELEMEYVPFLRPVDVVMNGEYKGNYQFCDQIDVRKGRVDIDKSEDGTFLIEVDAYVLKEDKSGWFMSNKNTPVTFKSPDSDDISKEERSYIQKQYNRMEQEPLKYLDIDSFLRHFLVGELTANKDTYWSVYMYKKHNDSHLYTGPVWDFDLSMDNSDKIFPVNFMDGYVYANGGSHAGEMDRFVTDLLKTPSVDAKVKEIWAHARQNTLTEENIIEFIDAYEENIRASADLNFATWQIIDRAVFENPMSYGSFEGEVEAVRIFIRERLHWMDDKLGYRQGVLRGNYEDGDLDYGKKFEVGESVFCSGQAYQVYTIIGELVVSKIEDLPKGIYIIRHGMQTTKIVVE